jgi:hypothetical protein
MIYLKKSPKPTALNPGAVEHRNLLFSTSVGNLFSDMKKQIENTVVGWAGQPLKIIEPSPNSLKNYKKIVFKK